MAALGLLLTVSSGCPKASSTPEPSAPVAAESEAPETVLEAEAEDDNGGLEFGPEVEGEDGQPVFTEVGGSRQCMERNTTVVEYAVRVGEGSESDYPSQLVRRAMMTSGIWGQMFTCYDEALAEDPDLKGRAEFGVVLEADRFDGDQVTVKGEQTVLRECVRQALAAETQLHLTEAPEGPTQVRGHVEFVVTPPGVNCTTLYSS